MNAKERDLLLEIWMDEFGSDVLNLACHILKNNQDAQDVFQNTFIKGIFEKK